MVNLVTSYFHVFEAFNDALSWRAIFSGLHFYTLSQTLACRAMQLRMFKLETLGLFSKERITFRKSSRIVILTLSWFESLILPLVNAKLFQIRLLKAKKKGVLDHDPPSKPDSEDLWMQSSFGTWFDPLWTGPLPHSVQILFVIRTVVAMLVNAHSSNHEPNQEADRDPKPLSECDSLLCEQAQC